MGGFSSEYRISINSGNMVYKHLNRDLYEPYRVHILQKEWFVVADDDTPYPINKNDFTVKIAGKTISFDCVFNTIQIYCHEIKDFTVQVYKKYMSISPSETGRFGCYQPGEVC